jgi:hypothetical protein
LMSASAVFSIAKRSRIFLFIPDIL